MNVSVDVPFFGEHSPPLLAASTASAGKPNWFSSGPSCPDARALLNKLMACRDKNTVREAGKATGWRCRTEQHQCGVSEVLVLSEHRTFVST